MEAEPNVEQELREAFARIEVAVGEGDLDLAGLGFWRRVAQVKRSRDLIERWAEQIARIDTAAFRAGVRRRVPVWAGNLVLLAELGAGVVAIVIAGDTGSANIAGGAILVAGVAWSVAVHCPAHWVVGRAVGIRFTDYFLGGPFPPRPGLKSDYATYLRASAIARAAMHAAGAIATKLAPFVALALAPAVAPKWSRVGLAIVGVVLLTTDLLFSVKTSDWKKVKRELEIARSMG